jgi:hypothetical protein
MEEQKSLFYPADGGIEEPLLPCRWSNRRASSTLQMEE